LDDGEGLGGSEPAGGEAFELHAPSNNVRMMGVNDRIVSMIAVLRRARMARCVWVS
jgi:hypothetical protein